MIPYGRQTIVQADIDAVVAALTSPFLTQGPLVPRFEEACAAVLGAPHAVASNSGTSGLHIACMALGLKPGDLFWTVPNTFVATANAALYCGAEVDFVDIDEETFLMDIKKLENKLHVARRAGRLPHIVAPVHFSGQTCDMAAIGALANEFGFKVIEDACHAFGASDGGVPVGACAHSDIAVFSFHPVKIITTAEGGLCTTRDPELARRMRLLVSHGISREAETFDPPADGPWDYRQVMLGYNYRLTEMQAALGLAQLPRLDAFLTRRRAIADRYDALLKGLPVRVPARREGALSAWHLYIVRVEAARRRAVFEHMRAAGFGVQVLYIPVHTQPFYRAKGFKTGDFPVAEDYYARSFTLPIHPTLSDDEQESVVAALAEALA